jgi:hypothetical protein
MIAAGAHDEKGDTTAVKTMVVKRTADTDDTTMTENAIIVAIDTDPGHDLAVEITTDAGQRPALEVDLAAKMKNTRDVDVRSAATLQLSAGVIPNAEGTVTIVIADIELRQEIQIDYISLALEDLFHMAVHTALATITTSNLCDENTILHRDTQSLSFYHNFHSTPIYVCAVSHLRCAYFIPARIK